MNIIKNEDTICSIITGGSMSAIAMIRISGNKSIKITNSIFSKNITKVKSHTIHHGNIQRKNRIIDEVLISIFKKNKSFTGEESVEISCHGSRFIQNKIIHLLIDKGCRIANKGEFTMRAFKNGKLDLLQAEAIADLVSCENSKAHKNALEQLKGKLSEKLKKLRKNLIDFASLIELELDFSEEDLKFADRDKLKKLLTYLKKELKILINSFELGNAIKTGIPVTILGCPNVGKSTLLNTLLNEEKAIVSDIAGTTRDAIEDSLIINEISFRFTDTAGIRKSDDEIEKIGIQKSLKIASKSKIILFLVDPTSNIQNQLLEYQKIEKKYCKSTLLIINKGDLNHKFNISEDYILISAKKGEGIEKLKKKLLEFTNSQLLNDNTSIITNIRHFEQLELTLKEIENVIDGVNNKTSAELLSINIRQALFHLGLITGEITTDDLLGNIFNKFCIGK